MHIARKLVDIVSELINARQLIATYWTEWVNQRLNSPPTILVESCVEKLDRTQKTNWNGEMPKDQLRLICEKHTPFLIRGLVVDSGRTMECEYARTCHHDRYCLTIDIAKPEQLTYNFWVWYGVVRGFSIYRNSTTDLVGMTLFDSSVFFNTTGKQERFVIKDNRLAGESDGIVPDTPSLRDS